MAVWVGLDLGTSSLRALLLDDSRGHLGVAGRTYPISAPRVGWAEQDPEDWWVAAAAAIREVLATAHVAPADVAGIGVTGQMHGLVLLDAQGQVTRPAIIWPDRRSTGEVALLDPAVQGVTGLAPAVGFLGPSLAWVRAHESAVYAASRWALLPKDHLRFRLTGGIHTEPSDACGTGLFDIHTRTWSGEVADALGVDRALLPPVVGSATVVGQVTAAAADALGLAAGTPVVAGAGDQATSALALGLTMPGDTAAAISSGGTVLQYAAVAPDPRPGLNTLSSAADGFLLHSAILAAGLAMRWLARVASAPSVAELADAAATVRPGADGLIFLPHLAGERTDTTSAGSFIGLTLDHGTGHLARAVMEGVAFALGDCVDAVSDAGTRPTAVVAGGGGLANPVWRQILADVTGLPVHLPDVVEHSATGAALLAAQGVGGLGTLPRPRTTAVAEPSDVSPYSELGPAWHRAHTDLAATMRTLAAVRTHTSHPSGGTP